MHRIAVGVCSRRPGYPLSNTLSPKVCRSPLHCVPVALYNGAVQRRYFHPSSWMREDQQKQPKENRYWMKRESLLGTVPNVLTTLRLVGAPVVAYCVLNSYYDVAVYVFGIAGFFDAADGYIARKFDQGSILGSYLDPLADKMLVGCTTVAVAMQQLINPWLATLIIGRDVGLILGVLYMRWTTKPKGVPFFGFSDPTSLSATPSNISKANTGCTIGLIISSLTYAAWGTPEVYVLDALSATVGLTTIWSGTQYILDKDSYKLNRK
eukprot:gb/GECG01009689.1/.p1 GENE.gb/GECG01009689.1/~~gb/GECG01009689.1/.p1  ORF type:complete len:266 (+),score=10.97 gb/GECG01009689.1/:1-798(+)